MGKITFILGGARSGKSSYALKLVGGKKAARVAFIATGEGLDEEMRERIGRHKTSRPSHWTTFEEPRNVSRLLGKIGASYDRILIDCLTLLVSNLFLKGMSRGEIEDEAGEILSCLKKTKARSVIVSNEVGLGIVPRNKLARDFRDIAGRVNQIIAAGSDEAYLMVSGIPWRIK